MTQSRRDYRETLFLPKTDFPMRAGLPKKEPEWLAFWDRLGLYEALRRQSGGRPPYCLHDGPPYANGHIHMGTALNKIHKDIINRSRQMAGFDANYVPGWDCHGLPIEWKVEEEFRARGRNKKDVKPSEFRARCREYAQEWLDTQREEFKRLGVIGDWDNPYVTMKYESEADICRELLKIAGSGQLYHSSRPIMWSPVEQTALAEAEVEYRERQATQIYVRFPVSKASKPVIDAANAGIETAHVVIWTTTPWTIPANRAVSYSPNIKYGLYEITTLAEVDFELGQKTGDRLIVADRLWETVARLGCITGFERLGSVSSGLLGRLVLSHPLGEWAGITQEDRKNGRTYDFHVPMFAGDHVTADAGTGFVHTAPSHGEDDFNVWMANGDRLADLGIDPAVPITLDDAGCYTNIMPERFRGLDVIRTSPAGKRGQDGRANSEVIRALIECGHLLSRRPVTLRDAHSWRSKAPVIRRATPQWFISMSKKGLRETALSAINRTTFYPERGRNRLHTMVKERPDWLISRQRAWGVPITIIVGPNGELHTDRDDADEINTRILAAVCEHGVDGWFDTPLEELMPDNNDGWEKVTDILDVWFDSGSTHAFCLTRRKIGHEGINGNYRADLYLEGSDQHRGWFQSSLLESCAVYGEAPYRAVMTDGFVVDEKGHKMSKSLGNTVNPIDIGNTYGADILRLWVAGSDVYQDLKIGREIIRTHVDAYRKLRNTLRYMIGALDGYDNSETIDYALMPALERWVLHRLYEITQDHERWVRDHEYSRIFSALFKFCTLDLSAFYFDIRKDALYCDPLDSARRRACRTVIHEIFERLTTWLAPILCFTMEEVWQSLYPSRSHSVHMEMFRSAPEAWKDEALAEHMERLRRFRTEVNEAIEPLRRAGAVKSGLEAALTVPAEPALVESLKALKVSCQENYTDPAEPQDTLADLLIVSHVTLSEKKRPYTTFAKGRASFIPNLSEKTDAIAVKSLADESHWRKCERSWKYFKARGEENITPRDAAAVRYWDKVNR